MNIKKIIAGITGLIMAFVSVSFPESYNRDPQIISAVSAARVLDSENNCYIFFDIYDDHAVVTGFGETAPIPVYSVIIPETAEGVPVTEIGDYAAANRMGAAPINLSDVVLPSGLKKIGKGAFQDLSLESIDLPETLEEIGEDAFSDNYLKELYIPGSVRKIGSNAFGKNFINKIEISEKNNNFICEDGFLLSSDKKILYLALTNGDKKEITVPDTVKTIGSYAFSNSLANKIILPEGVEEIGEYAFNASSYLNKIKYVNIPSSVKKIGESAVSGDIDEIAFDESNTSLKFENGILYSLSEKRVIAATEKSDLTEFSVHDGIEAIDPAAFRFSSIEKIVFPDSLKKIGADAFLSSSLTDFNIPENLEYIGDHAFENCPCAEKIILPDSLTYLGESAFRSCKNLKEVRISENLTGIKSNTFLGTSITELSVPESVESLDAMLPESLKKIYIYKKLMSYRYISLPDDAEIVLLDDDISGSTVTENGIVFSNDMKTLIKCPADRYINDYTVPETVEVIADNAFLNCYELNTIELPAGLKKIGKSAFASSGLEFITVPENTEEIGDNAFDGCDEMTSAVMPESITSFGKYVFRNCRELHSVKLPDNLKKIPEGTFENCNGITCLAVPKDAESIEKGDIPLSVKQLIISSATDSIPDEVLAECADLETISGEYNSEAYFAAERNNLEFIPEYKDYSSDINGDEILNIADMILLKSAILDGTPEQSEEYGGRISRVYGDADLNGKTDSADYLKVKADLMGVRRDSDRGIRDVSVSKIKYDYVIKDFIQGHYLITDENNVSEFEKQFSSDLSEMKTSDRLSLKDKIRKLLDEDNAVFLYNVPESSYEKNDLDLDLAWISDRVICGTLHRNIRMLSPGDNSALYIISVPKSVYNAQYLQFREENNYNSLPAKPVIYLYPEENTEINVKVKLDRNTQFTYTYPEYPSETGWTVTATPDSVLYDENGREYSYLFWEASTSRIWNMNEGFVVKGSDTVAFLQEKLEYLGLTPREYNEFIVYWMPKMQNNAYNLITFQTDDYENMAKLEISPEPDCIQRVFMTFKALDEYQEVSEQKLEPFTRNGYTVIEWGGAEIH